MAQGAARRRASLRASPGLGCQPVEPSPHRFELVAQRVDVGGPAFGRALLLGDFAGQGGASRVLIKTASNQIFLTGPGAQMRVDTFEIGDLSGLSQIGNGNNFQITGAGGVIGFSVGARLRVNAGQAPGDYNGSFAMTFNYQ